MSIRVLGDGADGYRLLSPSDEILGWARGRAIGISGCANDEATVSAAIRAYVALGAWLERQGLHPLPTLGDDAPTFMSDGAHRWLLVGRVPVARLSEGTPYDAAAEVCSFEIVLRGFVSEGMMIHAALVALRAAHGAMDGADIAWSSRRGPRDRRAPVPVTHLELQGF